MSLSAEQTSDKTSLVTSLAFPSHRSLVTVNCKAPPTPDALWNVHVTRSRLLRSEDAPGLLQGAGAVDLILEHEIGCFMPLGGHMQLQRAKWAQHTGEMLRANAVDGAHTWHGSDGLEGWVVVSSPTHPKGESPRNHIKCRIKIKGRTVPKGFNPEVRRASQLPSHSHIVFSLFFSRPAPTFTPTF